MLEPMPARLAAGDLVALEGRQDATPAPGWWTEGEVRARDDDARPGSPGARSVVLMARPGRSACLHHHLDGITARAGKLLPVRGRWRLALWLRAPQPGARVRLRFARHGAPAFVDRVVEPSVQWRAHAVDFEASDDGSARTRPPPGPGKTLVNRSITTRATAGLFADREAVPDMLAAVRMAVRLGISAYDAQYAVLAETLGTRLVTEDKRLRAALPERAMSL